MDVFLKTTVTIVIALIFLTVIPNNSRDFSVLVGLAACIGIATATHYFLEPILTFVSSLQTDIAVNNQILQIILKASGVAILSEFLTLFCSDTGNAAMGKAVQLLGTTVILWLSLPLFTTLLELVN